MLKAFKNGTADWQREVPRWYWWLEWIECVNSIQTRSIALVRSNTSMERTLFIFKNLILRVVSSQALLLISSAKWIEVNYQQSVLPILEMYPVFSGARQRLQFVPQSDLHLEILFPAELLWERSEAQRSHTNASDHVYQIELAMICGKFQNGSSSMQECCYTRCLLKKPVSHQIPFPECRSTP